jgi:PAS domain S-box-containing protein
MAEDIRILILEDRAIDAELVEEELREAGIGFSSLRVDTRDAFQEALTEFGPHLILADYQLPSFDGLEALDIAQGQSPEVPFIFVSGVLGEELAIEMLHAGATDYVLKQRLSRLGPAVRRALAEVEERARRRRAEVETTFRSLLLDNATDSIFVTDMDGRILYVNKAAYETRGYSEGQLLEMGLEKLILPDHAQSLKLMIEYLLRSGELTYESDHLKKDGTVMPVEIHARLAEIGGTRMIIAVARDITERRQAEQELRRVNRALRTISDLNQVLVLAADEPELLREVCRIIVEVGGYSLAWVGFAEQDEKKSVRRVAAAGGEKDYLEGLEITWGDGDPGLDPTGDAIRTGKPKICRSPGWRSGVGPVPEQGPNTPLTWSMALPLTANGETFAALSIYAKELDAFAPGEAKLLRELADDLAYGIMALRTRAEHMRAERELRESQERFALFVQYLPGLAYIKDEEGRILYPKELPEKAYHWNEKECLGKTDLDLWPPEVAEKIREDDQYVFATGECIERIDEVELDGKSIAYLTYKFPILRAGSRPLLGSVSIDITDRRRAEQQLKKSEEQLRHLSSQLLFAQEKERKHVAQDLHDTFGQTLAAIKFGVEHALEQLPKRAPQKAKAALSAIVPMAKNAVEEVRRIQRNLRPPLLDDLGILAAIPWFCREFQSIYSMIQLEHRLEIEENEIPDPLKIVIYRIIQESSNNIAKHSKANRATISLKKKDGQIELAVQDDGQGFEAETPRPISKGLGLASMRERTELSGGTFSIESRKGAGTTIRATWANPEALAFP